QFYVGIYRERAEGVHVATAAADVAGARVHRGPVFDVDGRHARREVIARVGPALIHGDAGRGVVAVENFEAVETIVAMMAIGTRILHGKPALSARQSGRWADGRGEHLDIRG